MRGADEHDPGPGLALDGVLDGAHHLTDVRRVVAAHEPQPPALVGTAAGEVGDVAAGPDALHADAAVGPGEVGHQVLDACAGPCRPHPWWRRWRRPRPPRRSRRRSRAAPTTASAANGCHADRAQAAARGGGAPVGRHHAGREQRAHLEPVEQAPDPGHVVHQLGIALGELVEVGRHAVAVEGVGLDQAGRHDGAAERDLGGEVADRATGDGAERLVGGVLELVDPAVGEHGGAHDQGVGVELDRAGQQPLLAGGRGPDVLLRLGEGGRGELGRVGDVVVGEDRGAQARRGSASRRRTCRRGPPAPASRGTCRR